MAEDPTNQATNNDDQNNNDSANEPLRDLSDNDDHENNEIANEPLRDSTEPGNQPPEIELIMSNPKPKIEITNIGRLLANHAVSDNQGIGGRVP